MLVINQSILIHVSLGCCRWDTVEYTPGTMGDERKSRKSKVVEKCRKVRNKHCSNLSRIPTNGNQENRLISFRHSTFIIVQTFRSAEFLNLWRMRMNFVLYRITSRVKSLYLLHSNIVSPPHPSSHSSNFFIFMMLSIFMVAEKLLNFCQFFVFTFIMRIDFHNGRENYTRLDCIISDFPRLPFSTNSNTCKWVDVCEREKLWIFRTLKMRISTIVWHEFW